MPTDALAYDNQSNHPDPQPLWDHFWRARERVRRWEAQAADTPEQHAAREALAAAQLALEEHYVPLVRQVAQQMATKLPPSVVAEELLTDGLFGLVDAIDAFNRSHGATFETFARLKIRGAILDYLRSIDETPRLVRQRTRMVEEARRRFVQQFGRPPGDEELAAVLERPQDEAKRLLRDARMSRTVSLHEPLRSQDGDDAADHAALIPDARASHPRDAAERRCLRDHLTRRLTRAERLIVILYYHENLSMREIGQVLDLSESRVSQMHSSILARLRAQMVGSAAAQV